MAYTKLLQKSYLDLRLSSLGIRKSYMRGSRFSLNTRALPIRKHKYVGIKIIQIKKGVEEDAELGLPLLLRQAPPSLVISSNSGDLRLGT